jgi:hypothetical protein
MHLTEHHKPLLDVLYVYDYPGFSIYVAYVKRSVRKSSVRDDARAGFRKRENLPHLFLTSPSLNYVLPSFSNFLFFFENFENSLGCVCGHFFKKKYDKIFFFLKKSRCVVRFSFDNDSGEDGGCDRSVARRSCSPSQADSPIGVVE